MQPHDLNSDAGSQDQSRDLIVGQKLAFAAASVTLGACAYISLLGVEKAVLAIVFGLLALRKDGARPARRLPLARFGVVLGAAYIVLMVVLLILFRDEVMRFFQFLEHFQATG